MNQIFRLSATLPALALVLIQLPGGPPVATLQAFMATDCPQGTVWDDGQKLCVPAGPRGSHGGAEDGA